MLFDDWYYFFNPIIQYHTAFYNLYRSTFLSGMHARVGMDYYLGLFKRLNQPCATCIDRNLFTPYTKSRSIRFIVVLLS